MIVTLFLAGILAFSEENPTAQISNLNSIVRNSRVTLAQHNPIQQKQDLMNKAQNTSENLNVRVTAIFALRSYIRSNHAEVRELLLDLAKKDYNASIRAISLRALARGVARKNIVQFLQGRAKEERTPWVKIEAVRALARVQWNLADTYSFLLDEFKHSMDLNLQVAIVNSLYYAVLENHSAAIETLRDIQKYNSNPDLKVAAIKVLSLDCPYFGSWICPENPNSACSNPDPLGSRLYCP
jgi:hypothetical protein